MVPHPHDGEVGEFVRMDPHELQQAIISGELTDDAAIVWLNFLVRHDIVDDRKDPELLRITGRMHRRLPFPITTEFPIERTYRKGFGSRKSSYPSDGRLEQEDHPRLGQAWQHPVVPEC
jgi:hypothetical protein